MFLVAFVLALVTIPSTGSVVHPARESNISWTSATDGQDLDGGWTEVNTSVAPPAMAGGMMAYSSRDHRFVLFGGWNGDTLGSTWIFDPSEPAWRELQTIGNPPPRGDGMLVYEDRNDVFILFGGWYESPPGTYHRLDDTWAFYLKNQTWIPQSPDASPSPRSDSGIAYDSTNGISLLVGGFDGTQYLGDIWYYEFSSDTWRPLSSPNQPSPRADGRLLYDDGRRLFFLFGGNDFSGPNFTFHHLGDLWAYDWGRNEWNEIATDVAPSARDYAILATDGDSGELLMVGGYGNFTILGDVWAFNTTRLIWRDITIPGGPPPRYAGVGAFSIREHVLVVFSGLANDGLKSDTWLFRYPPPIVGTLLVSSSEPVVGQKLLFVALLFGGSGTWVEQSWTFGDGESGWGSTAVHAFSRPGIFEVRFAVKDDLGQSRGFVVVVPVGAFLPLWADFLVVSIATAALFVVFRFVPRKPSHKETENRAQPASPAGRSPIDDNQKAKNGSRRHT